MNIDLLSPESIEKQCCFTGHRPYKLKMPEEKARMLLEKAIDDAINDGYRIFISGMAEGIDIWAAEIVFNKRKINGDIKLVCASPYKGAENGRSEAEKTKYNFYMKNSDFSVFVCERYLPGCFYARNKYMVDRSSRVIAAYNGSNGGTAYTVAYAKEKNIEVINILE